MGYNKITLYGSQTCDYLYIQKSPIDTSEFDTVDSEPSGWNSDTLILSTFNNESLSGGNSVITESINGYEIRRKEGANPYTEYVGTIPVDKDDVVPSKFMVDYAAKNDTDYIYYLYPSSKSNGENITLSPFMTKEIHTDWGYWTLMLVDETPEDNVYYLNKMFKFELNLDVGEINNNAVTSVTQNFTKYPTVQHGMSNYWSGSLSALSGFINCSDCEYIQTPNMIKELKSLTSDTRRKFLKDIHGNIWEVDITSSMGISTENGVLQRPKTVSFTWTEVGDASGISIINNPNKRNTSWILTETGEAVPYVDYIWDENYIWDNNYMWTAKEDTLSTKIANMGRELFNKGGDT